MAFLRKNRSATRKKASPAKSSRAKKPSKTRRKVASKKSPVRKTKGKTAARGKSTSTKRGRQKRSRRKQNKGHPIIRKLFKLMAWLVVIALVVLAGWVWTLDRQVQSRFNTPFENIPAHLYARPYTLKIGDVQTLAEIRSVLMQRGYRAVPNIQRPGEFKTGRRAIDIYRPASGDQPVPQMVRVGVDDGRVTALTDHRNGKALAQFSLQASLIGNLMTGKMQDRILLKLHEVPQLLLDALLTMEDRRFATHFGVDPLGILRAVVQNLRDGRVTQGGSTLTQQLVKNLYLDSSRTLSRKINEAMMALIIEQRYSKKEILERYVNTIFLGQAGYRAIHGFGLASRFYFDRDLQDLHPAQLAMLVGMIPAPSKYNPFRNVKRATQRRDLVLKSLKQSGYITAGELELYTQAPLGLVQAKQQGASIYPAFADLLTRELAGSLESSHLKESGVKVYSTLDQQIQLDAQQRFRGALSGLEKVHGMPAGSLQGAMMIVEPKTGEVVALIGGRAGKVGDFNRALDARRPIGSLVKPAVYLTALLNPDRYSTMTFVEDAPLTVNLPTGDWSPHNYDKKFRGKLSLYDALIHSYNVPAVKLGMDVGLEAVATTLQRLGVYEELSLYPSMLLGASDLSLFEVTQMYQTLANGGKLMPLTTLRTVSTVDDVVLTRFASKGAQQINASADFLVRDMLRAVAERGTARALQGLMPGLTLAGKTGTTNDFRDSWFAGFSDNYLAVVWVGKDDNSPTGLTGSSGALRVWAKVMSDLDLQSLDVSPPMGVAEVEVDLSNGEMAVAGCTEHSAKRYFISGYEPRSNQACAPLEDRLGGWLDKWFSDKKSAKTKGASGRASVPDRDNVYGER